VEKDFIPPTERSLREKEKEKKSAKDFYPKFDLLMEFLYELHRRDCQFLSLPDDYGERMQSDTIKNLYIDGEHMISLYDSACLVVLTRIIQKGNLRSIARDFIQLLPKVPSSCFLLLKLLAQTGIPIMR